MCHFNPRSRKGSDRELSWTITEEKKISIHAPAKGATENYLGLLQKKRRFQSTLPQRERHALQAQLANCCCISIHAPAKGATGKTPYFHIAYAFQSTLPQRERLMTQLMAVNVRIFQSTLPQRERRLQRNYISTLSEFQSTLPQRERLNHCWNGYSRVDISIHAPAKGATFLHSNLIPHFLFQSTLPQRERQVALVLMWVVQVFQSTLPQRERLLRNLNKKRMVNFNPRSRKGSDGFLRLFTMSARLFQSTLPQRERLIGAYIGFNCTLISIHAPAKGATARPHLLQ